MSADDLKLPVFFLKPGEVHIDDRPGIVTTVLGSCVSVTMFHKKRAVGAICHGLMPEWDGKRPRGRGNDDGLKYVDYAISYMTDYFRSLGIDVRDVEVKLFGGADMFPVREGDLKYLSVGKKNVMVAISTVKREGMNVHVRDVGGTQGRKLHFYTHTGDVFLKKLRQSDTFRVIREESAVARAGGRQVPGARRRTIGLRANTGKNGVGRGEKGK